VVEAIENLLLEHLKRFQASLDRVERKCDELIIRVGQFEGGLAVIGRNIAHSDDNIAVLSVRLDRMNERIERIERRLDLS